MYDPWNLGGLNPYFFVIWGGLAPPSPYVEPPLIKSVKLLLIVGPTVLNKLQSHSRISALDAKGHCTSRLKRAMCISCHRMWTSTEGEWGPAHVDACEQREWGVKNPIFVDVINGWPLTLYNS